MEKNPTSSVKIGGLYEKKKFLCFFYRNKLQVKKNILFSKIFQKNFLSEKNPTSSVKIRGFGGQKMFFKFAEILLIISSEKEKFLVLAVFRKTFSIGKKSDFKFQNRGILWKKNVPQICWNFGHN